jgi:hypothetical protein
VSIDGSVGGGDATYANGSSGPMAGGGSSGGGTGGGPRRPVISGTGETY